MKLCIVLVLCSAAMGQEGNILPASKPVAATRGTVKPRPDDVKAVAEHERVRPRLETKRPEDVLKMAEELGHPVIVWAADCWPDDTDDAAEFFAELSEARHVVMGDVAVGKGRGPRVCFRTKDGAWAWMPDGCLTLEHAKEVRKRWEGERPAKTETVQAEPEKQTTLAGRQLPAGYTYSAANGMVCGPDGCQPAASFMAKQQGGRSFAPQRQMAPQFSQSPARRYGSGG